MWFGFLVPGGDMNSSRWVHPALWTASPALSVFHFPMEQRLRWRVSICFSNPASSVDCLCQSPFPALSNRYLFWTLTCPSRPLWSIVNLSSTGILNDITRALRHTRRRAERKWKKDHLQVSLDIMKNSLVEYQCKKPVFILPCLNL